MGKEDLHTGLAVIQSLFENGKTPLSDQFIRWRLWKQWNEIVGPTMSQVCEPVGYRNGVLIIWVQSSSWMQQMIFMIEPLKTKINKFLDRTFVQQIRFTLDRKQVPSDTQQVNQLKDSLNRFSKK